MDARPEVEDGLVIASPEDDLNDPEFLVSLIEGQLPELYKGANFFGARHSVPSAVNHAHSIVRLLESANGPVRDALLRTGGPRARRLAHPGPHNRSSPPLPPSREPRATRS